MHIEIYYDTDDEKIRANDLIDVLWNDGEIGPKLQNQLIYHTDIVAIDNRPN